MRYYVEGSPDGPESFVKEREARTFAQKTADTFGVVTTLHSSATGHTGIRRGVQLQDSGKTLAIFRPRPRRQFRVPGCPTCDRDPEAKQLMPPHDASDRCESGKHSHCSCDTCF